MPLSRGDFSPLVSFPRSLEFLLNTGTYTVNWFGLLFSSSVNPEFWTAQIQHIPNYKHLWSIPLWLLFVQLLLILLCLRHKKPCYISVLVLISSCLLYPWFVISVFLERWSRPLLRVDASNYVLNCFWNLDGRSYQEKQDAQNILGFGRLICNLAIVYAYVNKLSNMVVQGVNPHIMLCITDYLEVFSVQSCKFILSGKPDLYILKPVF